jgi:tRNA A-37 threonylcarbamoyl transferase component Bud32
VVFQSTWNGRKATLRLFHGMDMKTKLIYSELSAEEKARLARLDWREAVRLLKELNTDERAEQGYTSFELAALEQATAINRLVQSRRMQGLRYQGREIVPGLFALVRNAEGLIVGLISEYVPGKDFEKLVNQKALTEAEIDQVIDQAIEQIRILGRKGFYHGDPGGGNILVTKGRGAKLIARLIDFSTDEFLPLTGQANWEGDIEALEHQRKKMKAQLRPWYGGNGRMLDVLW